MKEFTYQAINSTSFTHINFFIFEICDTQVRTEVHFLLLNLYCACNWLAIPMEHLSQV